MFETNFFWAQQNMRAQKVFGVTAPESSPWLRAWLSLTYPYVKACWK